MTKERVELFNPDNRRHYTIRCRRSEKGSDGHLISEWDP